MTCHAGEDVITSFSKWWLWWPYLTSAELEISYISTRPWGN